MEDFDNKPFLSQDYIFGLFLSGVLFILCVSCDFTSGEESLSVYVL